MNQSHGLSLLSVSLCLGSGETLCWGDVLASPPPTPPALMLVTHVMLGSGHAVMAGIRQCQLALQLVGRVWLRPAVDSCYLI